MPILIKRVYDRAAPEDGRRILVDRLWPRGLAKRQAGVDEWRKDVAPSDALRRWFGHDPSRWEEFCRRYWVELQARPDSWRPLLDAGRKGTLTLVFGAKDAEHSNAVALRAFLERQEPG